MRENKLKMEAILKKKCKELVEIENDNKKRKEALTKGN
jgi:hypothetical protein